MLSATSREATERKISVIDKYHLRTVCLHIGLVITCIGYAVFGAILFQSIEKPIEIERRQRAIRDFDTLRLEFFGNLSNFERAVDVYTLKMMELFEDPHYAHTFEAFYGSDKIDADMWSFSSALIFTTTTVIPVGYGYIYPVSMYGKMLLVIYALLGIPLTLVTMADTGKFASQLVTRWFSESMSIPAAFFVCLLFSYPLIVGYFLHCTSSISFLDAVYFSLTSIFTIGFGDVTPDINVINLVLFISIGVILVTITVDFVAVEVIDHVHYMGRHVGKAKELAGKMFQLAQSLNMKSGLVNGVGQLHALARFGMIGQKTSNAGPAQVVRNNEEVDDDDGICAFAPALMDGLDFVDNLSIYSRRSRHSPRNSARNLFLS